MFMYGSCSAAAHPVALLASSLITHKLMSYNVGIKCHTGSILLFTSSGSEVSNYNIKECPSKSVVSK